MEGEEASISIAPFPSLFSFSDSLILPFNGELLPFCAFPFLICFISPILFFSSSDGSKSSKDVETSKDVDSLKDDATTRTRYRTFIRETAS